MRRPPRARPPVVAAALALGLALGAAPAAAAQAAGTPGRSVVAGIVYDSIANAPLAGATVQVVAADDAARTWSARTDSAGAYRVTGLAPGRYYVGFHHPRLDVLGLREPVRLLEVGGGAPPAGDLAIPSGTSLVNALCDPSPADPSGMVLGRVRDAGAGTALAGAEVVVMWVETRIDDTGRQAVRRQQAVPVGEDGRYAVCGVPTDVEVAVLAQHGDDASGLVPVPIPPRSVGVAELTVGRGAAAVVDSAAAAAGVAARRGTARLAGTVYFATGAPMDGVTVLVHGTLARDTTGRGGQFDFPGLPAGSHTLLVHAMGYEPRRIPVQLASGRTDSVSVMLGERTPRVERVTIAGSRERSAREGFDRRRARGLGFALDGAEIAARAPRSVAHLLRAIPDVRVDLNLFDESILLRGCAPHVWLDGAYLRGGARDVSYLVDPRQLVAVEVYATLDRTPRDFVRIGSATTMGGNCGTVLLWTTWT